MIKDELRNGACFIYSIPFTKRSGERKVRLERGHREAEKLFCRNVWWSLRLNFDDLHPEFEVLD